VFRVVRMSTGREPIASVAVRPLALARDSGCRCDQLVPHSARDRVEVHHRLAESDLIEGGGQIAVRESVTTALSRTTAIIWSARVRW